jgi:hypothetical protein
MGRHATPPNQAGTAEVVKASSFDKLKKRLSERLPKLTWARQYKDDQGRIIWHKEHTLVYLLFGRRVNTWFDFLLSKYGPPIFYIIQVGLLYLWFFVSSPGSIEGVLLPVLVSIQFFVFYVCAGLYLHSRLPRSRR